MTRPEDQRPADPVLAKVRKLLAKAEDPAATPEEAETYTAKAAELIAAYGIDRALLAAADPGSDVVGDRVVVLDPPYGRDKAGLLATVATAMRCQVVQRQRWVDGGKQLSLHLFGYGSDLQRAEVLYTSLLLQATGAMTRAAAPPGESVAAFRRSWLAGFSGSVGRRLRDAERGAERAAEAAGREAAAPGARSVALVLADRGAQVASAVQREYPSLGRARTRTLTGSGGAAGWAAGERADLGGARVSRAGRGELAR